MRGDGLRMARFRVGLVGCGYVSQFHLAALRRIENATLCGVLDQDRQRGRQMAERLRVEHFDSLDQLREAGIDVVHVLTPPATHASITRAALELGCHVYVEKPLALDPSDCLDLERLAAERGLRVCVGHSLLFDPQVQRTVESIRRGRLGRVVGVDIVRSSSYPPYAGGPLPPHLESAGYPFRDLGVHGLYLLQALLGPIEQVEATWASLGGEPNLAFDEWRAQVRCRDGLGQLQLSWNVKPHESQIIVRGTRGVLRADLFLQSQTIHPATPLPRALERLLTATSDIAQPAVALPGTIARHLTGQTRPYHGLQNLVVAFYRALESGAPAPVSVRDALPIVEWTERIAGQADRDHRRRVAHLPRSERVAVLVTGASGALGRSVVQRLRSEGYSVRILVRRLAGAPPEGVEVVLGDLGDPRAVDSAVRGAEMVVHAGAATRGGWIEHQRSTVLGTQHVVEACRRHGVKKLIHISSLAVVKWTGARRDAPLSEDAPYESRPGQRGAYSRAKLEAERLVAAYARAGGPAVILRPGQIFGAGLPLITGAVARCVGRRAVIFGDGRQRLPLVELEDVVDAIIAALRSSLSGGEIVQLVNPEQLTRNELLCELGIPRSRVTHLPSQLVLAAGFVAELLLRACGMPTAGLVYRLRSTMAHRRFDTSNAYSLLGWSCRRGTREGLRARRTVRR